MIKAQVAMQGAGAVIEIGDEPENGCCAGQLVGRVLDDARVIVRGRECMIIGA
jgi:hypothetical protein